MLDLSSHCKKGIELDISPQHKMIQVLHRIPIEKGKHTRQHKQNHPVNNQDRPEYGDIEDSEPRANEADSDGASGRVPELELGQTADEGPELLVLLGREAGGSGVTVLETLVLGERRVELGRQESEEEVQEVNAECVGDCDSRLRR